MTEHYRGPLPPWAPEDWQPAPDYPTYDPCSPERLQSLKDAYYRHVEHDDPAAQYSAYGYLEQILACEPLFEASEPIPGGAAPTPPGPDPGPFPDDPGPFPEPLPDTPTPLPEDEPVGEANSLFDLVTLGIILL